MAENLISSIQEMLKEETWTRETINAYTQSKLSDLSALVEQARNENALDEVIAVCNENLTHSKESIIALYLSGMISLIKGDIDNPSLETLVDIFQKNHKEQIIASLCETILEEDKNNKFALRKLAEVYKAENNDKVWELYASIIKVDMEECELCKAMAEHCEELGDEDNAIDYYKKALLRYVNAKNLTAIKELWAKLVEKIPEEYDFFQLVRRKIAKSMNEERTTPLMQELYGWYKDNQKWDTAIEILKQNLSVDAHDGFARKELVECYKGKYASHSRLEDYIKNSNLTSSFRNVFEAINDFEKHIAFDKDHYVFHRDWKVGKILSLKNDTLKVYFGKKNGVHEMSLKMAVTALKPLSQDHIWVLKANTKPEELKEKIKEDKAWALKTIIQSFDNSCDMKRIKAELVPGILSASEWTSWNSAAKKILESDASFAVNQNDINCYMVRQNEVSPEEKISNEFKAQKQFFSRVDILMKFYNSSFADVSSEIFSEMYSYFTGNLKNISRVTEQVVASFLIVKHLAAKDSTLDFHISDTFASIYNRIENPREMYMSLKDTKNTSLKEDFISQVRLLPNWAEQFIYLFPTVLDGKMLETLVQDGHTAEVQKLVRTAFENFRDYRETVLFFFKECQEKTWFQEAGVTYEKQLITLINIMELCFREINSHVNSTENKKIQKNAQILLFEKESIYNYIFSKDENTVKKMYTLVDDISDLDGNIKAQMRSKILEKYPEFKFQVSEEKATQTVKGMIVTKAKLDEKKEQIDNIQNNLIPANAKEVAEAREKGDLKENAEYKAAKEKQ
ncbi:MAG: transcription elongation factor GreA, partial [Treponema sp.]|nr:transcription elongation factor GreA [Treponema sp.]